MLSQASRLIVILRPQFVTCHRGACEGSLIFSADNGLWQLSIDGTVIAINL